MDLTRHWYAQHKGSKIEVQWTGTRFRGGWTLYLLVDGKQQAQCRSFKRNITLTGTAAGDPIQAHFIESGMFRNRCTISAGGVILSDGTQPWNALILLIFATTWGAAIAYVVGYFIGRH